MCGHSFTYHSVIPPTHCPICGACLGCGSPRPAYPRPWGPYWQRVAPAPNTVPNLPIYPTVTC